MKQAVFLIMSLALGLYLKIGMPVRVQATQSEVSLTLIGSEENETLPEDEEDALNLTNSRPGTLPQTGQNSILMFPILGLTCLVSAYLLADTKCRTAEN